MDSDKSGITSLGVVGTFLKSGACSTTSFRVLDRAFDHILTDEEQAAMPFAGGVLRHGYQCGLLWGAALAAGAQAHRLFGSGPQAETRALLAAQRLVESFRALNNDYKDCLEITELDQSSSTMQSIVYFLIKGGTIRCFASAAKYAPVAFRQINSVFSEDSVAVPSAPVSCSALLAQKMGASDAHTVMAAGLAGGIGLCGGACGALAAAIWITGINSLKEQGGKLNYNDPRAAAVIEKFLKCTDYEFECSKIVGRKFESVGDHASYMCNGGCRKIIDGLSNGSSPSGY